MLRLPISPTTTFEACAGFPSALLHHHPSSPRRPASPCPILCFPPPTPVRMSGRHSCDNTNPDPPGLHRPFSPVLAEDKHHEARLSPSFSAFALVLLERQKGEVHSLWRCRSTAQLACQGPSCSGGWYRLPKDLTPVRMCCSCAGSPESSPMQQWTESLYILLNF